MKKAILTIIMLTAFVFPAFVFAADTDNAPESYHVTYDGQAFTDNFHEGSFDEVVKGMEPGDQVTFTINLENTGAEAEWYISNEVLSSFEDNERASGGAYSYRLVYTSAKGEEKELYNSETVGGESTVGGIGLHQVPEDMKNFFYLDTLGAQSKGTIKLTVGLDGETQGNLYQNATSSLALQFAAYSSETPAAGTPNQEDADGDADEDDASSDGSPAKSSEAKTGDDNNLLPYALLLLAAGLGLLLIAGRRLYVSSKEGSNDEE